MGRPHNRNYELLTSCQPRSNMQTENPQLSITDPMCATAGSAALDLTLDNVSVYNFTTHSTVNGLQQKGENLVVNLVFRFP